MNKLLELAQADKELKEISAKVETIRFHLQSLESNIALLNSVRIEFEQNLAVLKTEKLIAAINEYKKIKEDHQTVLNRLYVLRIDQGNHVLALERAEKMLLEAKERYAILFSNQDAKIIRGNFGRQK